jgi:hypothetical protein
MEALTNMMSLIDVNSESIPEGDYLKLCNFMMDVHKAIPKKVAPTPFQPVTIPEDVRNRRTNIYNDMRRVSDELRRTRSSMKTLKIRKRVTESVRRDAIRDAGQRMGLTLRRFTLECLQLQGVVIPNASHFYKEYMERTNSANQILLNGLTEKLNGELQEWDRLGIAHVGVEHEYEELGYYFN